MSTNRRVVVLDQGPIVEGKISFDELNRFGSVELFDHTPREQVIERASSAEIVLTNKVPLGEAELEALRCLRYIGVLATGFNVVDVEAARARDVAVTNVRGYSTMSVAQHVFALLLDHTNRVAACADSVRHGRWRSSWCYSPHPTTGLAGKRLGIVGFGAIGRQVATIGQAFGMEVVLAQVPGGSSEAETPEGFRRLPLRDFAGYADVISLHCPLTPATTGIVNADFLSWMKSDAVLINTARGPLIDEVALAEALVQKRLARACLDVLSAEPPSSDHPLLQIPVRRSGRLTITGHMAWTSPEARYMLVQEAIANIEAYLAGERRNRVD